MQEILKIKIQAVLRTYWRNYRHYCINPHEKGDTALRCRDRHAELEFVTSEYSARLGVSDEDLLTHASRAYSESVLRWGSPLSGREIKARVHKRLPGIYGADQVREGLRRVIKPEVVQ